MNQEEMSKYSIVQLPEIYEYEVNETIKMQEIIAKSAAVESVKETLDS